MKFISPIDAMFLIAENHVQPMHAATLQLLEPPEHAGPGFVRDLYDTLLRHTEFDLAFTRRPRTALGMPIDWAVEEVDLRCHVKHSGLPHPGGMSELLDLVSDLHRQMFDRTRPPWEVHLIEGLQDGRFALYFKWHHALFDGISAQTIIRGAYSTDALGKQAHPLWHLPPGHRPRGRATATDTRTDEAAKTPPRRTTWQGALDAGLAAVPSAAPKTVFNVPIGSARRCEIGAVPISQAKTISARTGTTINDVILAITGGALRAYLNRHDRLPVKSIVAMVPVSLRPEGSYDRQGGNKVGAALCKLGTDIEDPLQRLARISGSMLRTKQIHSNLSSAQSLGLSALLLAPGVVKTLIDPVVSVPPPFNVVISNIPGIAHERYWGGARLSGMYPLSFPLHGHALNITVSSIVDELDFGFVACAESVPALADLPMFLLQSAAELTSAVGASQLS
ncbi:wax ester/triacylglycerol synthase family O-acyltransferase [Nocardia goodfellowii]|uniref:Diacylglycerol O-acyltransferase n=1 Tax=Nocardia goodfellowii TaxID=882446 RepID=A0ABS4QIU2_9NOCA|nr:wax ester/triacylglycerol synthase family O-acyltransferase [Nocardia goodfellowii]MBP2191575.1 WS/DGAT/MGAT family acyltransferase [Nocardia goodfellowii]